MSRESSPDSVPSSTDETSTESLPFSIAIKPNIILSTLPPRDALKYKTPFVYKGEEIGLDKALKILKDKLAGYLNYGLLRTHNAILQADQKHAENSSNYEAMLTSFDIYSASELSKGIRDMITNQLIPTLVDVNNEHLTDAAKAGYKDMTTESLWDIHDRIGNLEEEDITLLIDMTLSRSTLQLARGLELVDDDINQKVDDDIDHKEGDDINQKVE